VDDPEGQTGMAHMFEHMAFKGTSVIGTKDFAKETDALARVDQAYAAWQAERRKGEQADPQRLQQLEEAFHQAQEEAGRDVESEEFSKAIERNGGVGLNAGTSYDYTVYFFSLPSNKLELWFSLESARFLDPVLRDRGRRAGEPSVRQPDVLRGARDPRREPRPVGVQRRRDDYRDVLVDEEPRGPDEPDVLLRDLRHLGDPREVRGRDGIERPVPGKGLHSADHTTLGRDARPCVPGSARQRGTRSASSSAPIRASRASSSSRRAPCHSRSASRSASGTSVRSVASWR